MDAKQIQKEIAKLDEQTGKGEGDKRNGFNEAGLKSKENGIEVTDKMSADDVINALKEKQSQPTPQTGKGQPTVLMYYLLWVALLP